MANSRLVFVFLVFCQQAPADNSVKDKEFAFFHAIQIDEPRQQDRAHVHVHKCK